MSECVLQIGGQKLMKISIAQCQVILSHFIYSVPCSFRANCVYNIDGFFQYYTVNMTAQNPVRTRRMVRTFRLTMVLELEVCQDSLVQMLLGCVVVIEVSLEKS